MAFYLSNASLENENCADISDWVDGDVRSGESTQVDNPLGGGLSTFKFDSKTSADTDDLAGRNKNIGSIDDLGNQIVVSLKLYCDAVGTMVGVDNFFLVIERSDWAFNVKFCSNGLFIYEDEAGWVEVGADIVQQDTWQEWTFDIDLSGGLGNAVCDVYLNNILQASDVQCDYEGVFTNGLCELIQYGYSTDYRISYADWFKVGDGFEPSSSSSSESSSSSSSSESSSSSSSSESSSSSSESSSSSSSSISSSSSSSSESSSSSSYSSDSSSSSSSSESSSSSSESSSSSSSSESSSSSSESSSSSSESSSSSSESSSSSLDVPPLLIKMKSLREEDASLYHHIKNYVLQAFIEEEENISLSYLADESSTGSYVYEAQSSMYPSPTSKGRGWAYLDEPTDMVEQTNSVTVRDSNEDIIDGSNYMVDYVDGRIICDSLLIVPVFVDYRWHYVSVVNEWMDVQAADVPVIAIGISGFTKQGFQLGAGKFVSRRVDLHIFASDQAEKDDLSETLYDGLYLKSCSYYSFSKGTMIDWDGTFNSDYSFETIDGSSNLKFDNVESRTIKPTLMVPSRDSVMLSDLNRYRNRISFDMIHWEEDW